jgi:hypothetical protein
VNAGAKRVLNRVNRISKMVSAALVGGRPRVKKTCKRVAPAIAHRIRIQRIARQDYIDRAAPIVRPYVIIGSAWIRRVPAGQLARRIHSAGGKIVAAEARRPVVEALRPENATMLPEFALPEDTLGRIYRVAHEAARAVYDGLGRVSAVVLQHRLTLRKPSAA